MSVALDDACFEASLEEMTTALVAAVEPHRVDGVQALHSLRELGLRRLDQDVEVVVEQDPGVHLPPVPVLHLGEEREPGGAVAVVEHDRPPLHAAADHVVPGRARQLLPRDPRHSLTLARSRFERNRPEGTSSGTVPGTRPVAAVPWCETAA
jgi:hypothetical protein